MVESLGIFKDNVDDSIKCVFDVGKNKIIEMTLLFNRADTDVICVPTHHFCNLGCKMCHLTNNSLNKKSEKILYEYFIEALLLTTCKQKKVKNNILNRGERRTNKRKLLLSFMGVGEPTLNLDLILEIYKNVDYIKQTLDYDEIGFALATMMPNYNLKNYIDIINSSNVPLKIHFSLHNPIDRKRDELIPSSKLSVKECLDVLKYYNDVISKNETIMASYNKCHRSNDLVEIHYTLIDGSNDGDEELNEMCKILNEYGFTIKFIRFNPKDDMCVSRREEEWVNTIKNETNSRVKTYSPPGRNIGSSCGEFTKHYYHEEIETKEQKDEFLAWKTRYEIFD